MSLNWGNVDGFALILISKANINYLKRYQLYKLDTELFPILVREFNNAFVSKCGLYENFGTVRYEINSSSYLINSVRWRY